MDLRPLFLAACVGGVGCGSGTSTGSTSDASAEVVGSGTCPAAQPSGPCTDEGLSCSYGCEGCTCDSTGQWYCTAPGCAGGCPAVQSGPPPVEGTACGGGCCGPIVGETCMYTCADGGGQIAAICEAPGKWHVSPCGGPGGDSGSDAGGDARVDGGGDAGGDAACVQLFQACTQDSECCMPYRCIDVTGALQCQLEGPAVDH